MEIFEEEPQDSPNQAANYDKAIAATGYGLFNTLLLLALLPVGWTCIIDTTSTAFMINSVECEFELTWLRRGIAVSIIYMGMTIAGPIWDFLLNDYITGYLGKKYVMIAGLFLDAICNILWTHASSYYTFVVFKFFSGVLIAGPLSVFMAYLGEFHAPDYQQRFNRWAGLLILLSNIVPPALAAALLTQTPDLNWYIYNRHYPSWRVYLLIFSVLPMIGLLLVCFMPKSPKFLMAQGRSKEALQVLKIMYCMNHFEPASKYPIKELIWQQKVKRKLNDYCRDKTRDSISHLKSLFSKPYVRVVGTIALLQFVCMSEFNVMRLWVPSLFTMMNYFEALLLHRYPEGELVTLCEMIFPRFDRGTPCNFTLPDIDYAVFINSTIIATAAVSFSFVFPILANSPKKKIILMIFTFFVSTIGCFGANWGVQIPYMLVLVASVIVSPRITGNTIILYNAEVVPQVLRPAAISVINFFGNLGALAGNIMFSFLLSVNCYAAFLTFGCIALVCISMPLLLWKGIKSDKIDKSDVATTQPEIERY
ncbi:synaptic vesicle glycoprotein 2B-like [Trichogramma pretiosum]|uniref:synaptic vesicle glycoprotein 2B-like n=1 Tax=Trichogramma pretiosum TaxID=7493 RepID=UPI0006C983BD|nr:synaptic vesicle glycoprotein 2B-like [Trichogramma pretiosum]